MDTENTSGIDEPDISDLTGVKRKKSGSVAMHKQVLRADPCSYCGLPRRCDGGPNHWSNYTAACEWCNALKSAIPLWVFLLGRELLERDAFARMDMAEAA
jgi:hypothetical protein